MGAPESLCYGLHTEFMKGRMPSSDKLSKVNRPTIACTHDVFMALVSLPLSLFLRIGMDITYYDHTTIALAAVLFAAIAFVVFWSMRLYRGVWRYASLNDLSAITKAVTFAILIFVPLMFLLNRLEWLPRSTLFINWFVLIALLGGPRFLYRRFKDKRSGHAADETLSRRVPVLLVGAGDAAEMFIRALGRNPMGAYEVVGIIDEKGGRVGRNIHGVHVLGTVQDIPAVVDGLSQGGKRPQRVIVTKDDVETDTMRALIDVSDRLGFSLARLPSLTDFRSDVAESVQVRPIAIEDVLGRAQHVLDRASMQALIKGRRVLVTGAGGTIGGELARQLAGFQPAHLCLLDASEYALYSIDLEIGEAYPDLDRSSVIADVRDAGRVAQIMGSEAPELVFHAAALKHVPIVEAHPGEGIRTNILGTKIVADCCRAANVAAMVLISTDKAVNPTSVMGASKRIAETYCQALDIVENAPSESAKGGTRYITVRFGNVLGSTGSVVPLFQRQLASGGPLTVTHPDMQRYFMTVREAVELVLEASVLGTRDAREPGKIYVLDMGDPIKIMDLARQMILLAGKKPEIDIRIEITGLRPGEKLYEEILHDSEPPETTDYAGILLAAPRTAELDPLSEIIESLVAAARDGDETAIIDLLRKHVPEYRPEAGGPIRAVAS
jgi:FlaA1/EpsC-like NDP-sugar epimerase